MEGETTAPFPRRPIVGGLSVVLLITCFLSFLTLAFFYSVWNQIRWNLEGRPHTIYLEPGDRIWHVYYPLWIHDLDSGITPFPDDLVEHSKRYIVHDFWTPFRDYFAEDEKDEALFTYPRFLFLKDPDDQWHHVEVKGLAEKLRWLHY